MPSLLSEILSSARHATLSLPAMELLLLLILLSFCLVMRYNKIGLVTAYLFSYKWGWTLFSGIANQQHLFAYLVFGSLVGVLATIGMLRSHHP